MQIGSSFVVHANGDWQIITLDDGSARMCLRDSDTWISLQPDPGFRLVWDDSGLSQQDVGDSSQPRAAVGALHLRITASLTKSSSRPPKIR